MIQLNWQRKIAFISSFLPRKCGIATFTSDLIQNTYLASTGVFKPVVVAMQSDASQQFCEPVECVIRKDIRSDYMEAADYINSDDIEVVSLQHEFGLFGGEAGSYIVPLLRRLNVPVISTLHTILEKPSPEYFQTMIDVCDCSDKIIIMNRRGIDMLRDLYGVSLRKIELIPHGIPEVPFGRTAQYKRKLGLSGRIVLMTFGLIGPNKGIEVMLNAMPTIARENPEVLYLVVGTTHPEIVRKQGYLYKNKLKNLVVALRLEDNVVFHDKFVTETELSDYLAAADIYVTPYLNKEQLTSGTLAFAVGCGKVVVSTPYWAAEELLANGRGVLVPFGDAQRMAGVINKLLSDESSLHSITQRAYNYGRAMTWSKVGQAYWNIFGARKPFLRTSVHPQLSTQVSTEVVDDFLKTGVNASEKDNSLEAVCL
jgi:glycosyltransferase involved in cell wall biosynthesis